MPTTRQRLSARELRNLQIAYTTPVGFARYASGNHYLVPPHIDVLSQRLERIAAGELNRLIVEFPPRHGKSEMCSKYFPTWFLGRKPNKNVILTSYEASFASSWGRKSRALLQEFGPAVFGTDLSGMRSAANWWEVKGKHVGGGSMMSVGMGGALMGKGADLLIIDDPIKNDAEAMSAVYRQQQWDWWESTASTRLEPGGAVLIIMTRWHEDDLAGRMITKMNDGTGENWEVLRFPALAEEDDPLGREVGEALWPARYDEAWFENRQLTTSPYWWSALYQQRPGPVGGTVFKKENFRYFRIDEKGDYYTLYTGYDDVKEVPVNECFRFATVDTAHTLKKRSDYTVCSVWAQTKQKDLLLLEVIRVKLEDPDIVPMLAQVQANWRPGFIAVEGKTVVQQMGRAGLPARELIPDADKWTRAQPAAARCKAGAIYFRAGASWLSTTEDELLTFPNATHDDIVDTVAYAAILQSQGLGSGVRVWT